ncbi:MAG: hypothetical protein Q8N96_02400 [Methylovulum sp.]|nr:hypothetical protein [Methylovulum sp.]
MKRNHIISDSTPSTHHEFFRRVAFHEAGHAVAIYLRHKQQQLPPVFFQISLYSHAGNAIEHNYEARVEGGAFTGKPILIVAGFGP